MTCGRKHCGRPARGIPLIYQKPVALCERCFDEWSGLNWNSEAERRFLAACTPVDTKVIDDTAAAVLAVL